MKKLSEIYDSLIKNPQANLNDYAFAGLTPEEEKTWQEKGQHIYHGKVRDLVVDQDKILMIHTDRLSAFDKPVGLVPFKGVSLAYLSRFWLEQTHALVPNHFISQKDDRTLVCQRTEPFKIEVIVRGYLAGSMARAYKAGKRIFCGHKLPEGLTTYQQLPKPLITPTSKADVYEHDEELTADEIIALKLCTKDQWEVITQYALKLFEFGQNLSAEKGWILVDTKYEFGKTQNGDIIVIDEIHTPDSSRYWRENTYNERFSNQQEPEMLDKEIVRKWLIEQGYQGQGAPPKVPNELLIKLADVYREIAESFLGEPIIVSE